MNLGKKQTKSRREKESLSQTMDSFKVRDSAKSKMIIFAGLLALFCLSTTTFGVGSISGHVDESGGSSLANVMLWLYQGDDPQVADENAWHWVGQAITDSSGNYQFTNLAARYYRIYVSPQNVGGTYYGKAEVHNVPVNDNQNTVRDITLQVAGSISGYVLRHSDNSPLQGVEVQALEGEDENVADWRAWWWAGSATTDSTGFYRINGLRQRRYHVHVDDRDIGGTHYVEADLYNVQVFSGVDTPNMDLRMREAALIEGHITTSTGMPIPNAWVISNASWTHNAWEWHDARTDQNGRYELWVLPSPGKFYPVWVRNAMLPGTTYKVYGGTQPLSGQDGYDPISHGYTLLGTGTATKTFSGTYTYYAIVTDDGCIAKVDTVQGSGSSYYGIYDADNINPWGNVGGPPDGLFTQVGSNNWPRPAGGYLIVNTPAGNTSFTVYIVNDGRSADLVSYESKWEQGNLVRATLGQDVTVDYQLDPGGEVTGRVVNESNVGISDVRIQVGWNKYGDFGDEVYTDSQGNFRLGGLTVGNENYVILDDWEIMHGGVKYMAGEAYQGPINIPTPGAVVPLPKDFVVYESGLVTGVIIDEAGFPIVDVEVDLVGRDINNNWAEAEDTVTDAFGQYSLDYVAPGTYFLECEKPGFLMTIIRDIKVGRSEHVNQDVVMNSKTKGATISGSIANYSQVAAYDSVNSVYYPYYRESDYEEYGLTEFGLVAMDLNRTYTDTDYLDIEQFFVGNIDDEDIEDGYGDYFQSNAGETPGAYTMPVPPGDIGVGMYIDNPETLAGWGGSVILHDWKRFTLAQGDLRTNVDFTADTGSTGELKGNLIVPAGYNYFPGDWCVIYAFALDSGGNRINPAFVGDAIAFVGFTTQYEIVNMPVGNYELKAYAMNLPSVTIPSITVNSGATTTQDINFTGVPSGTLSGKITDTTSGASVSGATVKIVESGKQAVTDNNGDYLITAMNVGTYTVKITAQGYADAQTTVAIVAGANTLNYALDSNVGTISGTVKDSVGNNVNAATVVAYNESDYTHKTAQTVGGAFMIIGLTPGQYVVAVDAGIYGVVTYPTRIPLVAGGNGVANIIVGTPQPPGFTVSSSASNTTPVVLSMEFYSDQDLLAAPQVSIVQGSGTLGILTPNSALNRFNIDYTAHASDTLVRIAIQETNPIVAGNPGSNTFSFEVTQNLVATSSTNFTNAIGGTASIMGTQDNTEVYVPPFAIVGAGSDTQALTLTIERYGDPGQTLPGTTGITASAVYDFEFDQQGVTIDQNHTFTVTMSFQLPAGMTQTEFENSLEMRYFDAGAQQWKTDGISNVRINWLNYTILFEISHLTKFAIFVPVTSVDLTIDIYPNRTPNLVFLSRNYTLYVAVLGGAGFDVTTLNSTTVKFGKTGTEASPLRAPILRDLNWDGFIDAMYGFRTFDCGFALGDTTGTLKGKLNDGTDVTGSDSVVVSP